MPRFLHVVLATLLLLLTAATAPASLSPATAVSAPAVAGALDATEELAESEMVTAHELSANSLEFSLFELTNAERAAAGVAPLTFNNSLLSVARDRAAAQIGVSSLTHLDASGQLAFTRLMREVGLVYDLAGENLARVPSPAADAAYRADYHLMQSPSHRANILDPRFTSLTVGGVIDESGSVYFAQIFHTPY